MTAESYKKQAADRRDARNTKGPVSAPSGSSRSTKRWCRGKVGVDHKLVVSLIASGYGFPRLVRHCSDCGKEFGGWSGNWGTAPEWASPEDLKALHEARQKHRLVILR